MAGKQPIKGRAVTTYPPQKYKNMLGAMARADEISESKVAAIAIKQYFDTMPADQRQRIQSRNSY